MTSLEIRLKNSENNGNKFFRKKEQGQFAMDGDGNRREGQFLEKINPSQASHSTIYFYQQNLKKGFQEEFALHIRKNKYQEKYVIEYILGK